MLSVNHDCPEEAGLCGGGELGTTERTDRLRISALTGVEGFEHQHGLQSLLRERP